MKNPVVILLTAGIRFYKVAVSPLLPSSCRFQPTCSSYALEAIELHGAVHGSILAVKRIGRCHPLHPGGFDPVPTPRETATPKETAAPRETAAPSNLKPQTSNLKPETSNLKPQT